MKELRSKIIAVAAVALMAVSFTACESVNPDSSSAPNTSATDSSSGNTEDNTSDESVSTEAPVPEFDDNGSKISAVEVTDAEGAAVTDADGAAVTELVVLDDKGKAVTDTAGKNVKPVISSKKPAAAVTTNSLDAIGKPDAMKNDKDTIPQEKTADGPTVSLPDIEASAGETVTFKVNISDNKGFTALVAWIEAEKEYFEFVKDECTGGDADDPDNEDSLPYSDITFTLFDNPEYPDMNTLSCLYFDGSLESLVGDAVFATVTLKVKEGTPAGRYDLIFDKNGDGDGTGEDPAMCNNVVDGKILIPSPTFKNGSITVK